MKTFRFTHISYRLVVVILLVSSFLLTTAPAALARPAAQTCDVTISTNTTWTSNQTVDTLCISSGATLTLGGAITVTADNIIINTGTTISADGQGHLSDEGTGAGTNQKDGGGSSGAGHGGVGGASCSATTAGCPPLDHPGGPSYGDMYEPTTLGSGGGGKNNPIGGAGGGAAHLIVNHTLTVDGIISANGLEGGQSFGGAGGGAGGSIWIQTKVIDGDGTIRANGGNGGELIWGGYPDGGGGAGGRIALYAQTDTFNGAIQAVGGLCRIGGASECSDGDDGSIFYVKTPSSLTANATLSSQIDLTWTDNADNENGFAIERKTGSGGTWAEIDTVSANVTSYANTGLAAGTTYYYRVRAYKDAGYSSYSNEVYTATPSRPDTPSDLTANATSCSQIDLTWTDNANNENGFAIERKTGSGGTWAQIATVGANVTSYANTGLAASTTYYYRVRAYNAVGYSPYSNEAHAATSACTGTLYGYVYERYSLPQTPLSGAVVSIAGLSDTTDQFGYYEINNVPVGSYTASCTHPDNGNMEYYGYMEDSLEITAGESLYKMWPFYPISSNPPE